ncbi:MAG: hypothetical protein M3431_03625, partial [Actinomycetota bacterium]|nr:hypothetical protein [Actinomycetota bacterium]
MEPLAIAHGPLRSTALRQRLDSGVDVVFVAPQRPGPGDRRDSLSPGDFCYTEVMPPRYPLS